MRSRKLLALLLCLITFPAIAGYMTLLGAGVGSIAPVVSWVSTTDAFPSSSLSFSRTSNATMFDSTGMLTYAPNNLLLQSNTFSNAAWNKSSVTVTSGIADPVGGSNASTITATGAGGILFQFPTVTAGTNVLTTFWVRRRTGTGNVWIRNAANTDVSILGTLTGTWTQFYVVAASNGAATAISMATSGDAVDIYAPTSSAVTYETTPRTADQVITTSSAYYGPRIDYDPNTLAVKGLLIEEARTNLVVNSNQFVSWTISGGSSVATNSNTQIDGTTNGNTFSLVAGVSSHQIYKSYTGTAVAYTNSVYAKAGTSSWLGMWFVSTAQADGAFFNLSNGTIGTVAAGTTAAIQSIGNGWYRCSITKTLTAATYYNGLEVHTADNQAYNFNAAGTESLYLFGAQGELGSFATSYIPTAAASVTRAADVVQFTGAALTALQGSAGSAIVELASEGLVPASNQRIIAGGQNLLYNQGGTNVATTSNGVNTLATANALTWSNYNRPAVAWSASGRSIVSNGSTVATDAFLIDNSGTSYLGSLTGSSAFMSGWYKSFAIYNQRLPDATLQAKSVVGASYATNDNGLRFADNDNLPILWRVAL